MEARREGEGNAAERGLGFAHGPKSLWWQGNGSNEVPSLPEMPTLGAPSRVFKHLCPQGRPWAPHFGGERGY